MSTGDPDFDKFFSLVGLIASQYAGLDAGIRHALGAVLGDTARARVVADTLPTEVATKALEDAIRVAPASKKLNAYVRWVLGAARRAASERASVAHSSWYLAEDLPGGEWSGRAISAKNRAADHRAFTREDLWHIEEAIQETLRLVELLPRLAEGPVDLDGHLANPMTVHSHEVIEHGLGVRPFTPP